MIRMDEYSSFQLNYTESSMNDTESSMIRNDIGKDKFVYVSNLVKLQRKKKNRIN